MKTHLLTLALFGVLFQNPLFAQDRTTVNATSNEISDNLDLRAVASIFGDSKDLQDFEQRLNDPKNKISNLDLNFDRQVDYLRVIEAVEKNTHLIILQAVVEQDVFQDVATIEVERDRNNQVQIQVVGDVFMYGSNYIYEPVYVTRPLIYNVFWVSNYYPYYSPYYFNYYPSYYYAWSPCPLYLYRRNVHIHINEYNYYNYSNHRRSSNAVALYKTRRTNGYERNYDKYATRRNEYHSTRTASNTKSDNRSTRNTAVSPSVRSTVNNNNNVGTRSDNAPIRSTNATSPVRNTVENSSTVGTRNENPNSTIRNNSGSATTRSNSSVSTRTNFTQQGNPAIDYSNNSTRNNTVSNPIRTAGNAATRSTVSQQQPTTQVRQSSNSTRNTAQVNEARSASSRSTAQSNRGGRF